ncbi:GmrSD restriction endonuclease domain-containing protein [Flavobacterium hercynium]|uniref:GmrSD restriction endonucleases N-terminal domain-containing protein n=1 Tax=Flavobacterium hercynium TaxID=387094 RepID=A0A226HI75_9FLAO|nr:DUF262 domain-containing protein [Flavobacterium hercynium]OXA93804.1 hypothetical protein B0A66_06030 [Flavobacterium hercynium]SMP20346.1 Protein of unknown function DUF262 [Flavobacterium hercynium]
MSNITETSQKLTFLELIKNTKIEIPIIQRDYAQGRSEESIIRNKILTTFYNSIHNNKDVELDFIYGNKEDEFLQPLDGQQRLTTLFLLHWYFACKETTSHNLKDKLSNFTYETRTSSREFCASLIHIGIDFKKLLKSDYSAASENNEVSKTIINSSWFFLSWKKDPTIKAMLVMLDAIHQMFMHTENGLEKLTEGKIKFNYIELKNFGLSDDLYIKMNARGKTLTAFENFKALLERAALQNNWELQIENPVEKFSHKIDTTWTNLFWPYRNKDNLFDTIFLKFISIVLMTTKEDKDLIQKIFNNSNEIDVNDFDQDSFNYLKSVLDLYHDVKPATFEFDFPFWQYLDNKDSKNFFEVIVKKATITYPQIVLFYAQTEFLLNRNENTTYNSFNDWMRVIRNIVYNSTIDSSETFTGAIALIKELKKGSNDIYLFLKTQKLTSRFAASQTQEEITKSSVIQFTDNNRTVLFETEDTDFCRGRISFALHCTDYSNNPEKFDGIKLNRIKDVFTEYIDDEDISNDFRRGLMTIDDNQFYNYWWSWLHAVNAPKRCLIASTNDLKNFAYQNNFRKYLKELIIQLTDQNLSDIIKNYEIPENMPRWKQRIIKEDRLLEYSIKHYIAIKDDNSCCWLIPGSKVANSKEGKEKCRKIK